MNATLSDFRNAIDTNYLPSDWRELVKNGDDLVLTYNSNLTLRSLSITCECGEIYHEEIDSDEFYFHDLREEYISGEGVCAYGRRGREFIVSEDECVRYDGSWYLSEYLSDNDLVEMSCGTIERSEDVYYWESDDEYHYEEEDNDDDNLLWCYSSGPKFHDFRKNDWKFGIGMEIEKSEMPDFYFDKNDEYNEHGFVLEKDCSVEDGFELKTPIYDLFSEETDEKIQVLKRYADIDGIKDAGGHIGFSSSTMTDVQLLAACRGWLPLIYAMHYGRIGNDYCKVKKSNKLVKDNTKMQSIRLRGDYIEFRIFGAVRNFETIKFRIEFFRLMAMNLDITFSKVGRMMLYGKLNTLLRGDVYADNQKFARLMERAIDMNDKFGSQVVSKTTLSKMLHSIETVKELAMAT